MADNSALEWTKLALTAVVGAIALSVGFIQYVATSSLSVRQPFLSRQMELCLAAAEHAARLATTKDEVQWQKSREDFWMLIMGSWAHASGDQLQLQRPDWRGDAPVQP